jgi:Raf kinase inhibitor-like YbhB/YbcL family protein
MTFSLSAPAFPAGGSIPARFACDGLNLSPQLDWAGAPAGTMSYVLVVDDPDAPGGTFLHWVLFDIDARIKGLPEGAAAAKLGISGVNDFGKAAYGGPCPPRGRGSHRYFFKLSALDVPSLGLAAGATLAQVDRQMSGHVLATATFMGRYERR